MSRQPVDPQRVVPRSAERQSAERQSAERQSAERQSAEQQPAGQRPAGQQSAEQQATVQQPIGASPPRETTARSRSASSPHDAGAGSRTPSLLGAVAAAFVLTLGVDVFLHAGVLARLYTRESPFLLDAEIAFRRIPLGYLAFLILTASVAWLMTRLDLRGAAAGARFGLTVGAVGWGALALGLYSISTAAPGLLIGWWLGQAIELALAAAVIGARLAGTPLRRLWGTVLIAVLVLIVATITLQSLGLAPAMRVAP